MGKYTIHPAWVDQALDQKLEIVVKEIKEKIPFVSLILVGGFGRGEGSVKIDQNQVSPLNDFDLYAIVDQKVPEKTVGRLTKKIEAKLGSKGYSLKKFSAFDFYLDLRVLTLKELKSVLPLIKYYEMKHASYVVSGQDVRDLIPDFKIKEIPPAEGVRFLLNRMSHILEWLPLEFFRPEKIPDWQKQTLAFAITKIYLEIGTAFSLIGGFYAPTYLARLKGFRKNYQNKFPQLAAKLPKLADEVEFFTNLKLEFDLKRIKDLKKEWFKARTSILEASLFYCQKVFKVNNWGSFLLNVSEQYFQPYLKAMIDQKTKLKINPILVSILSHLAQAYLTISWFFKVGQATKKLHFPILTSFRDPGLRIFSCLPYLIGCLDEKGNTDQSKFKKSAQLLKKVYPLNLRGKANLENFDCLRKTYINAWKAYYFQKLV